ncbi:MAG: serine/threonine-protein kinase [Planctomycetota bacterium]
MALQKIGPYTLQGILGRGGMGTVYRGVHFETGALDAVKVLSPNFADDDHFRGRFESEIKSLLKLNHQNIVKLLSFGQEDGMLFFSMELVNGNSLYDMQKQGHRFDWRQVLSIAKDCAQGLRHAHDRGVIHRDLKPGNLLMACDEDGNPEHVKLTDFGIAKRFGNSQNTGTNILGTMDFMSPEQAKGEPVSPKSDLYSLGTVMFTLLSGRPPFTSNSVEESLRNLTRVPAPRITSIKPDVPLELDRLISKLMAKRPEERVPTALALAHKLNDVEESLRENSQAKTAHGNSNDPHTFAVGVPKTVAETEKTSRKTSETGLFKPIKIEDEPQEELDATAVLTDDPVKLAPEAPRTNVNFYNTVTEHVRESQVAPQVEEPDRSKGALWLAIALIAVIGLGTYGVFTALQPPSAEQLYTLIQENADQPQTVLSEIEQFIELYPDEPRVADIAKMQTVARAIRNYKTITNRLTVRANSPSGLTEVEKQFMQIVDLASEQPDAARAKMAAFATFHETRDEELTESEQICVDAAKHYKVKRDHEVQAAVLFQLRQVREKFDYAATIDDKEQAITVYESIIELYGDTQWGLIDDASAGRGLIRRSKMEIQRLKKEIIEEAEAARLAEEEAEKAKLEEKEAANAQGSNG